MHEKVNINRNKKGFYFTIFFLIFLFFLVLDSVVELVTQIFYY